MTPDDFKFQPIEHAWALLQQAMRHYQLHRQLDQVPGGLPRH